MDEKVNKYMLRIGELLTKYGVSYSNKDNLLKGIQQMLVVGIERQTAVLETNLELKETDIMIRDGLIKKLKEKIETQDGKITRLKSSGISEKLTRNQKMARQGVLRLKTNIDTTEIILMYSKGVKIDAIVDKIHQNARLSNGTRGTINNQSVINRLTNIGLYKDNLYNWLNREKNDEEKSYIGKYNVDYDRIWDYKNCDINTNGVYVIPKLEEVQPTGYSTVEIVDYEKKIIDYEEELKTVKEILELTNKGVEEREKSIGKLINRIKVIEGMIEFPVAD